YWSCWQGPALQQMGHPMAKKKKRKEKSHGHGYPLVIYDVFPDARREFLDDGIITVLLTSINAIEQGSLLTDSSTIDPIVWKDLAKEVEKMGAIFRLAPVSDELLGSKDSNVLYCGACGPGQALRICYHILLAIGMIGTADAINLGISAAYNPVSGVTDGVPFPNNCQAQDSNVSTNTPIFLGSQAHQICVDDACKGLLRERLLVRVPVSMRRGDILSLSTFGSGHYWKPNSISEPLYCSLCK
ncbi:hypothetical protein FD754_003071, partial [Muntiacus muntjak]